VSTGARTLTPPVA